MGGRCCFEVRFHCATNPNSFRAMMTTGTETTGAGRCVAYFLGEGGKHSERFVLPVGENCS